MMQQKRSAIVALLLVTAWSIWCLHSVVVYGNNVTYAVTIVKLHVTALEEATIYGTLKLEIPKYLIVDRENEIHAIFERSGGGWSNVYVIFYISAKVKTASGVKEYDLGTISFGVWGSTIQERTVKIVIPKAVYDASVDKTITIYVHKIDVSKPSVVSVKSSVVEIVPARAKLVISVPEPVLRVVNLHRGYLDLDIGEVQRLVMNITSYYAPTLITDIDVDAPSFVAVHLDTPLPLTIGANQSVQIIVSFRGLKPGAGVAKITVTYAVGGTKKRINVYVPIVVSSSELDRLIKKYEGAIERYRRAIAELEEAVGIKTEELGSVSKEMQQLITTLRSLTKQYREALASVGLINKTLTSNISALKENLKALNRSTAIRLASVKNYVSKALAEIERLGSEVKCLSSRLAKLESNLDRGFEVLKMNISDLGRSIVIQKKIINALQRDIEVLKYITFAALATALIALLLALRHRLVLS